MSIAQQYKAVIFDWDGTLVDSTDWVLSAHNHVRQAMNEPLWTKEDIFGCSSLSTRELYPQLYGDRANEAISLLFDYTDKHNLAGANPYEGAKEVLELLTNMGLPLGVVSNKRHEPLNDVIKHMEWDGYFSCAVGAGHAERDKPSEIPLLLGMSQIDPKLMPTDVLYVGDTQTDLLCAQNTGCDVAFIQTDGARPDLVEKYIPDYVFMTTKEFYSFILGAKGQETAKIA